MDYTILRRAAESQEGLILYRPEEIAACQDLIAKDLVRGAIHTPPGTAEYAALYCATPDGRALIALSEATARILLKRRNSGDLTGAVDIGDVSSE